MHCCLCSNVDHFPLVFKNSQFNIDVPNKKCSIINSVLQIMFLKKKKIVPFTVRVKGRPYGETLEFKSLRTTVASLRTSLPPQRMKAVVFVFETCARRLNVKTTDRLFLQCGAGGRRWSLEEEE